MGMGRALALAASLGSALASCRPQPQTAADECRRRYNAQRMFAERNRTAEAVEDARCDAVEQRDREDAREDRRDAEERKAHEDAAQAEEQARFREVDAELAAIRRAPSAPELGATAPEARTMCERQRGHVEFATPVISCFVGPARIFACHAERSGQFDRCDVYYEDGDLETTRRAIEERRGVPDGYRVFQWSGEDVDVTLTMYARGVRLTKSRPKDDRD